MLLSGIDLLSHTRKYRHFRRAQDLGLRGNVLRWVALCLS